MKTQVKDLMKKITAILMVMLLIYGSMPLGVMAESEAQPQEATETTSQEAPEETKETKSEEKTQESNQATEAPAQEEEIKEEAPAENQEAEVSNPEKEETPAEETPAEEVPAESGEAQEEEKEESLEPEATEDENESEESEEAETEDAEAEAEEEEKEEEKEVDPNKRFKYRLLVGFGGKINTREDDVVLGTFENVALLGFESAADLEAARKYYSGIALFASVDGAISTAADPSAPTNVDTASASAQAESASINDNPLAAASEEHTTVVAGKTIALVDTGATVFNVVKSLSVLGGSGADDNGHGSALATIIGEINPNVNVISIKALDGHGKGSVASVYTAIQLAMDSGADIIMLPFSAKGSSAAITSIINTATSRGITVVVAAGNDGSNASGYCPANVASAITVGALSEDGEIAGFSNFGAVDAWTVADSTSKATAKVAAGLASGRSVSEFVIGAVEQEEASEEETEEVEEFETAYNTTSDSVVDGGVYIIRLRKDPKRSMVQNTGTIENGNKFVLSNGEKREDSSGQFKVQKINYNFYLKLRDNTNYIVSPEGGASYVSSNGTKVHMWYKTSSNYKDFDQWWLKSVDNGKYYRITNGTNTGMHLQTEGSNTAGGTAIHLWNATSGTQGDWIFERVHYYVKFNGNGSTSGSMSNQKIWQEVGTALTANGFSRTGYTFNGWNTNSSGTGTNYSNQQKVTCLTTTNAATINLYAKWKANTYSVKYDGNGSTSGSMSNTSHTYDASKALTSNAYSKTGYTFNGWNTKADGTGTAYANGASVKNLTSTNGGTVTLYAQWTPNTWYVEYNGNGSTSGSTAKSTHTYDTAKNLTNNGFAKTGYSFNGWNTKADGTGTAYANGAGVKNLLTSGTLTLYAQWKANDYTITLDQHGATEEGSSNVYYTYDKVAYFADSEHKTALNTVVAPKRTGYEFGGYFTKPNGEGTQYVTATGAYANNPYKLAASTTLYAKWTPNTYTVSMNANGGKLAGSGISTSTAETATATATFDETFTIHHAIREGYTFAGWEISGMENGVTHTIGTATSTDASADEVFETVFKNLRATEGTVTLKAKWNVNSYVVRYDANGGTLAEGTENPYDATFDESFSVKAPTRPGYIFAGWKLAGMEGSLHYVDDAEVTTNTYTHNAEADDEVTFKNLRAIKGETEITAIWADDKYHVVYGLDGGFHDEIADGSDHTYDYNKTFHIANPTNPGHKFMGWTIAGMDAGTPHIVAGEETDATALAGIKGTTFGKLNAAGGTVTMTATWEADDITVMLAAPDANNDYTGQVNYTYKNNNAYYEDAEHKTAIAGNLVVPTRDNYEFAGYFENSDGTGTPVINAAGEIPEAFAEKYTSSTNLYAGWEADVYEITLKQTEATVEGTKSIYEKYAEGIYRDEETTDVLGSVDVPELIYIVDFDSNSNNEVATPASIDANAPFAGYYDGETALLGAGGQVLAPFSATYFESNASLTAKWDNPVIKLPEIEVREGFVFDGWYSSEEGGTKVGNAGDSYTVKKNTTLYAHWTPDPELYYEANGGTGSAQAATIAKGKELIPVECGYTKLGYHFTEWNTKADGTGTAFQVGTKKTWNEDLPEGVDHYTLYAQWEKNELKEIKAIADQKYPGHAATPKVTVFDMNGDVVSEDDYTLTWENNEKVGTAKVTAVPKADGEFKESAEVSREFNIVKANAEYFELNKTNYVGIYDGAEHTVKATAKKENQGNAYKIGYGKSEAEAHAAAIVATSATTNAGFSVKDVADTGVVYFYIIPDNYEAFGGTLNVSITTKALTVSGLKGMKRTYDGTRAAELDTENVVLEGLCEGDVVSLNVENATAVSASKTAGTHQLAVSGLEIEGEDAANYTFTQPADVKIEIEKKELRYFYEGNQIATYDGTPKANNHYGLVPMDIVEGDDVHIGRVTGNVAVEVGEYEVKIESIAGEDAANYELTAFEEGSVYLRIEKAENEVSVKINDWTYGKPANTPVATAKFGAEEVEYLYSSDNGATWTASVPTQAGTHIVKATVPGTNNYDEVSATKEFSIAKAEIAVTANDLSHERIPAWTEGDAIQEYSFTVSGAIADADAETIAATLEGFIVADSNAQLNKAGRYESGFRWINPENTLPNYEVSFVSGTYMVLRNDTRVTANGYVGVYEGEVEEADGNGISVVVENDPSAVVYYSASDFSDAISALVENVHDVYGEDDETFDAAYQALAQALAESDYPTESPRFTEAGTTTVNYIVITSNSKPDVIVGHKDVVIRPATLIVKANDWTLNYGDEFLPQITDVTYTGLIFADPESPVVEDILETANIGFEYSDYENDGTVGTYLVMPNGVEEKNGKHNYDICYEEGVLTVVPRPVTLTWSTPDTFNYNGTERTITATVNDNSSIRVVAYTGNAATAIGDYAAVATMLKGEGVRNYTLNGSESASKAWSVVPFDNKLSVEMENWTYGDAANEPVVSAEMDADKAAIEYFVDEQCEVKTSSLDGASAEGERPTFAGTYYIKASLDTTDMYEAVTATEEFTIAKREVEIISDSKASTHGEPIKPLTYQMIGTAAGDDDLEISLATEASSEAEAGEYEITVSVSDAESISRNYAITAQSGTYTITKARMSVSATGYVGEYDGEAHGITVTLDPNESEKATVYYGTEPLTEENYKTAGTKKATAAEVTRKDAGATTIYYYIESKYYDGDPAITGSADIIISQVPLTVKANDKTIVYGDEAANSGVVYEGFVKGESASDLEGELAYAYRNETAAYAPGREFGRVGTYEIVPSGLTSKNYVITFVEGTLTVEKRPVTFAWNENAYLYDGNEHRPTATVVEALAGDDVAAGEYVGNQETNVGAYVTEVSALTGADAANYVIASNEKTVSHQWKITKAENAWNAEPAINDWTYGKAPSTPTSVAKFGNDTVVYEYKKAGLLHMLDPYKSEVPTETGRYIMRATVPGTENYKEIKATVEFNINPAEITISADSKSSMYRTALLPLTYTVGGDYVEGDELGVVLETEATLLSSVGEYKITAKWAKNPNYVATLEEGTYTITKGYLNISAQNETAVYDGQPHGIKVEIIEPDLHDATIWYSDVELTEENYKTAEKTDDPLDDSVAQTVVGSKTVYYFVESENFDKNPDAGEAVFGSRTVTVNKADLTVATVNQNITYGEEPEAGKPVDAEEGISYTIPTGCVDDLDITGIEYDYSYEKFGDAGEYAVTAKGIESDNYNITYVPGKLVVGKHTLTFTWESEEGDKEDFGYEYDGEQHKVVAIPVTLNGDTMGELAYENAQATDAGDYTAKVTALPTEGKALNYTFDADADSTTQNWGIEQAGNHWTEEPEIESWTYGEAAKTPTAEAQYGTPTFSYRLSSSSSEEDWTDEAPTRAGEYTVRAQVAETENYKGITGYATFEIEKAKILVRAEDKTSNYLEEIEEFGYTAEGLEGDEFVEGDELGVEYSCVDLEGNEIKSNSHVGEYEIVIEVTDKDALNNYDVTYEYGVYTLAKADATYETSGWTGEYDSEEHAIEVELEPAEEAEEALVFYSLTDFNELLGEEFIRDLQNDTTDEKLEMVLGEFDPIETEEEDPETGEITVSKGALSDVVSADGYNFKNAIEPTAVYYIILSKNYNVVIGSEDVTIAKKALSVTAEDKRIIYGEAASDFEVTYKGFVEGEDESALEGELEFTCEYNQFDNIGEYSILPGGLTSENYEIAFVEGTLTVETRELTRDMLTFNDTAYVCDGAEKTPTYVLTLKAEDEEGNEVEYELKKGVDFTVSGDESGKAHGTYNMLFSSKGNFVGEISEDWRIVGEMDDKTSHEDSGNLVVETDIYSAGIKLQAVGLTREAALSLLTDEELERIHVGGETGIIYLEVSKVDMLEDAEETVIDNFLAENGYRGCVYLDIRVYKKIGDDPAILVHDIGDNEITFEMVVPEEYRNGNENMTRMFILTRAHDGETKVLTGPFTEDEFEFSSSLFSGYAVAYKDVPNGKNASDKGGRRTTPSGRRDAYSIDSDEAMKMDIVAARTGDENKVAEWSFIMILAMISLGAIVIRRRQEK